MLKRCFCYKIVSEYAQSTLSIETVHDCTLCRLEVINGKSFDILYTRPYILQYCLGHSCDSCLHNSDCKTMHSNFVHKFNRVRLGACE